MPFRLALTWRSVPNDGRRVVASECYLDVPLVAGLATEVAEFEIELTRPACCILDSRQQRAGAAGPPPPTNLLRRTIAHSLSFVSNQRMMAASYSAPAVVIGAVLLEQGINCRLRCLCADTRHPSHGAFGLRACFVPGRNFGE